MLKDQYLLKQHTPIIHFQHDQDGATLRATEVKPKLDKFLIEKFIEQGIEYKKWLIGKGEHAALNYKFRVIPILSQKIIIANRMMGGKPRQSKALSNAGFDCVEFSPYFAQEKEFGELFANKKYSENGKTVNSFSTVGDFDSRVKNLKTLGLFTTDDIKITIFCFDRELKSKIYENLNGFFVSQNFGTRQSKGFGCFLPKGISDQAIIDCIKDNYKIKGVFQIDNSSNYKEKLRKINEDYTILKRGQNKPYIKSKLWEYFCVEGKMNWEKKVIKQHIKNNNIALFKEIKYDKSLPIHSTGHHIDSCNNENNNFYIRALLGLAEQYEFLKNDGTRLKIKIEDNLKYSGSEQSKAVDRFTSPMRYFISDSSIFITTTEIPDELINYIDLNNKSTPRKFRFTINEAGVTSPGALPIPANFDLEAFLAAQPGYGNNLK